MTDQTFGNESNNCQKSNADRIRAMTDEELVEQFAEEMGFCCPVKGVDCSLEPDCRVCFARWLKQEVQE